MKKDDSVYLRHITDSCERIERYMEGVSKNKFFETELLQDAVIRQTDATATIAVDRILKVQSVPGN